MLLQFIYNLTRFILLACQSSRQGFITKLFKIENNPVEKKRLEGRKRRGEKNLRQLFPAWNLLAMLYNSNHPELVLWLVVLESTWELKTNAEENMENRWKILA